MEQQSDSMRKTFKYKLKPTPDQDRVLKSVVWHCRALYNVALEQRKTWWERGQGTSATYYQQKAEVPALKTACPEYSEINAQVLQDVLLGWIAPSKPSSVASRLVKRRAIPASKAGGATPPSPARRW